MKTRLMCPKCGNSSNFYRDISIPAKLRVNKYGEDLKQIYDIEKDIIDNYFYPIHCCQCDEEIDEDEIY